MRQRNLHSLSPPRWLRGSLRAGWPDTLLLVPADAASVAAGFHSEVLTSIRIQTHEQSQNSGIRCVFLEADNQNKSKKQKKQINQQI